MRCCPAATYYFFEELGALLRQAIYFTEEIIQLDLNFNIFWPFISWGGSRFVQLGEVYGVGSQLFFHWPHSVVYLPRSNTLLVRLHRSYRVSAGQRALKPWFADLWTIFGFHFAWQVLGILEFFFLWLETT